MATYEQLTYNSPDGALVGNSASEKIGFYGTTPAIQPSSANQAVYTVTATTALATATISQVTTSGKWAFASSTVAKAYVARVKQMQVDVEGLGVLLTAVRSGLVTLGLLKGSA